MNFNLTQKIIQGALVAAAISGVCVSTPAAIPLADQPILSAVSVPGNLALALSVEFPTAISVAHPNRTYSADNTYIGYFDPAKCYSYRYTDGTSTDNYFYPDGAATNRTCSNKWSGNYLNWATMQTIDPFRWALTGGYRVIDTSSLTVLEKAWASNQGGTTNFPDSTLSGATLISGATPFSSTSLTSRAWAQGNKLRLVTPTPDGQNGTSFTATYFHNKTLTAPSAMSRAEGSINYVKGGTWPTGVNQDNMSARWVGQVTAPSTGNYTFRIRGDDGVRLKVKKNANGNWTSLGDTGWKDQGATNYDLAVNGVTANDTLYIEAEYYQGGGGAEISLQWQPPGAGGFTVVGASTVSITDTATHYNPANALVAGQVYEFFVRVKVCDSAPAAGGLESNCTQYPNGNYKPTGLMQAYSDKIRYSAFGYLNDSSSTRDGGVLRARQKFIAPMKPVPGGLPVANPSTEWDAATGVMLINPDAQDATDTTTNFGVTVTNSGVMNYLNKFGEITPGTYKTYDPVGELYYAAQRYLRNLGNVSAWTSMGGANVATKTTYVDGFPVITNWNDPIQYSCQRNFILGIGDVNTHADRNLPGSTGNSEPSKPSEVTNDSSVNATDWTNKVGVLQGLGNSLAASQPYNGCCTNNGALMAGLAYWANVSDIRPDLTGVQTIQTYWLDVLEFQAYKSNNQFYLAAKYGGFNPPANFSPDTATAAQFANNAATKSWWATTPDTVADGSPRPDNYYTAARADQLVSGLSKAFSSIATKLAAYSTSFSTSQPQVSTLGVATYSAKYDAKYWTGDVVASQTSFDANTGDPTSVGQWNLTNTLAAQANGTGWDTGRNIVSYNSSSKVGVTFRLANLAAGQVTALKTPYGGGNDAGNYINYVRGDRTNERSSVVSGSTQAYRDRASLLGDVVNAKTIPVGPPAFPFAAAYNPGYDAFKTTYANRAPMVYVAANDGMLHAIDGSLTTSTLSGSTPGREIWAYIPGAIIPGPTATPSVNGLASLGNPDFTHHYLVDATPTVADVDFGKAGGDNSSTDWRTILVAGLGKGGKAYYALDITNPASVTSEATAAQKVLWEFSDSSLGYTYGQPIVTKTRKYGWVVIVSSGYNNADGVGYLYFIHPKTGALLEKVAVPCSPDCSASNQSGLSPVNAFVLNAADGYADAVYAGDLLGNVWRLDITGTSGYPTPIRFAVLTASDGTPLPVTAKPLPVVQPHTNLRYVAIGTGRLLDQSDISSTQPQRFFVILDGTNAVFSKDGTVNNETSTLPENVTFPIRTSNLAQRASLTTQINLDLRSQLGWYFDLGLSGSGSGWRVLTDPASFYGMLAFATTSPTTVDACSPDGKSRIYVVSIGDGYCALDTADSACYASNFDGVVTDLSFISRNVDGVGKLGLITGTSTGAKLNIRTKQPGTIGIKRLNTREILVN